MAHSTELAILLCSLGVSASAAAKTPAELFEEGMVLLDKQDYAGAISALERANAAQPHVDVQYNLGLICAEAGRYQEAIKWFELYLGQPSPPIDATAVRSAIRTLKSRLNFPLFLDKAQPAASESSAPPRAEPIAHNTPAPVTPPPVEKKAEPAAAAPVEPAPAPKPVSVADDPALDEPIPAMLRIAILKQLVGALGRGSAPVLVVFPDVRKRDRDYLLRAFRAQKLNAVGVSPAELSTKLSASSVVYVGPGAGSVSALAAERKALTVTGVPQLVAAGEASVGLGLENNKPKIVVNSIQLAREGVALPDKLKKMAKVY